MPAQSPPTQSAEASVAAGLAKIALVLRHESWRDAWNRGLTPTQVQILAFLVSRPHEHQGIRQVAEHLAIAMGTASDAVAALERKGLIAKKLSSSDGRAVILGLTPRGRRHAKRSIEWPDVVLKAVGDLSVDEQAVFMRGLVKIIRSLQEQGKIPVSRMCVGCRYFRPNEYANTDTPHHCDYVDAAFGDRDLRLDCREMEPVGETIRPQLWQAFVNGHALDGSGPGRRVPTRQYKQTPESCK